MARKRAAIYTRISRDAVEKDGKGVARQEADCRALAKREKLDVVKVYPENDKGASSRSRKVRTEYAEMLKAAWAGEFDVIVAYSNSRLTRRPAEWLDLIELANKGKVEIKTVKSGKHDLSTADGRAVALTVAAWDAAEAERTAERVARAHRELAKDGRYNGPRPFGWNIKGKGPHQRLVIDEAEAEVIRECVRRVIAGHALWSIAGDLGKAGVVTPQGSPWRTQTLRRMLLRWMNCGMRSHRPLGDDGLRNGPEQLFQAQWDAIVTREEHEQVRTILTDPKRKANNRGTEPVYLLTAIARCGACKQYVVGTTRFEYEVKGYLRKDGTRAPSRTRIYPRSYKCPHRGCMKVQRRMDDVDHQVIETVLRVLERDGVRILGGDPAEAAAARAEIARLEAKLEQAADRFAADEWTSEQVDRVNGRVRPALELQKARLMAALPRSSHSEFTGPGVREAWANASLEARKALLRTIGIRIEIMPVGPGNGAVYDPAKTVISWED